MLNRSTYRISYMVRAQLATKDKNNVIIMVWLFTLEHLFIYVQMILPCFDLGILWWACSSFNLSGEDGSPETIQLVFIHAKLCIFSKSIWAYKRIGFKKKTKQLNLSFSRYFQWINILFFFFLNIYGIIGYSTGRLW